MSGPDTAVAALRSAVRRDLTELTAGLDGAASDPAPLVLVACSGGADSLALAAATAFVAPRLGLRAGAVVVDHGLQEGSSAVAGRAAAVCADLGLDPVEVVRVVVSGAGDGPESAARTVRYAALDDCALRLGSAAVLLGHTLDDQAETVLLGLARGSGARSLAGMAPRRGLLRRPLLAQTRATTEQACAALGLVPWHDPTNTPAPGVEGNRRAVVRHVLLPALERELGPGVAQALARTAEHLRADADLLDALAADVLATARTGGVGGDLDVDVLAAAPSALRGRALHAALIGWGCPAGSVLTTHVDALDALVTRWHGQGGASVPGGTVARRCGRLAFNANQGAATGGSFGHG